MVLESQSAKTDLHKAGQSRMHGIIHLIKHEPKYMAATTPEQEPIIPSPAIFDFDQDTNSTLSHERGDPQRLPVAAACATHLELLGVFYSLRQTILASKDIDASFGIAPRRETKTGFQGDTKTLKDDRLWDRRQAKWKTFVDFAALRFLVWRKSLERLRGVMIVNDDGNYSLAYLPPLDIIMVWHSFMLNPQLFYQTCGKEVLFKIRMPWRAIHDRINNRKWTFAPTADDREQFKRDVNLSTDLYTDFVDWKESSMKSLGNFDLFLPGCPPEMFEPTGPPRNRDDELSRNAQLYRFEDCTLAFNLREAVQRQCSFVDKMNGHMWIRSPALEGTLRRAIARYGKFLNLLCQDENFMIVPTLDIDLVWHTHQCAAMFYGRGMKAIVGRFINHDDSVVESRLDTGFETTQQRWKARYKEQYRACGCWDCEALQSAVEELVRCGESEVDMTAVVERVKRDVTYYRAVEVAIREQRPLPRKLSTFA